MKNLWHWLFWPFAVINIALAFFGYYSIFLFILLLLGVSGLAFRFVKTKLAEKGLLIIIIAVFTFSAELIFRTKDYLKSYPELTGSWFYKSQFNYYPNTKRGWVYTRTPNITKKEDREEYYYRISTNNDGLRDENHQVPKPADHYRIVALGGSFTEGVGVSELEETWVKILEQKLNKRSEYPKIQIFNGGVSSSDPFYALMLLKDKLLKYDPDLVILTINESDLGEIYIRGGEERFNQDSTVTYRSGPWYEPLFGMSYIARHFLFTVLKIDWMFRTPQEVAHSFSEGSNLLLECIKNFEKLGSQEGFELLIVLQPDYSELEGDKFVLGQLGPKIDKQTDVRFCNAWKNLRSYNGNKPLFWPIDGHFTQEGNLVFATLLETEIINYKFIQ